MLRPARTVVAGLVAALVAGALAACTPKTEPRLAVGRGADGVPVVHVYLCGDKHAAHDAQLYLSPWPPASPSPAPSPGSAAPATMGDLWSIWNGTGIGNWWTVPMGTTPDGWHDELDPPRPLALTAEGRYVAGAWTDPPQPLSVFFTLADLEQLKDGELWGRADGKGEDRVITAQQFRERAQDGC